MQEQILKPELNIPRTRTEGITPRSNTIARVCKALGVKLTAQPLHV